MISITIDTDWAPQELVDDVCNLLEEYGVTATFFCTDDLPTIPQPHEVALHPNFLKYSHEDAATAIDTLQAKYPDAIGVRSHSLHTSSRITDLFKNKGLQYQSNYIMHGQAGITPIALCGLTELPLFFVDDYHARYDTKDDTWFSLAAFDITTPGLKIFGFHPIHIFLNTASTEEYESIKQHYHDVDKLKELRNLDRPGARTLFIELLAKIRDDKLSVSTLKQLLN